MTQVREILDRAVEAEQRLEDYLGAVRDAKGSGKVRLLTYTLRRRCSRLRIALESLYPGELETTDAVPYGGASEPDPARLAPLFEADPAQVTGDELLRTLLAHGRAMVSLYDELQGHPLRPDLVAAFQGLLEREQKDCAQLERMLDTDLSTP